LKAGSAPPLEGRRGYAELFLERGRKVTRVRVAEVRSYHGHRRLPKQPGHQGMGIASFSWPVGIIRSAPPRAPAAVRISALQRLQLGRQRIGHLASVMTDDMKRVEDLFTHLAAELLAAMPVPLLFAAALV
jgi:hypothetical protein